MHPDYHLLRLNTLRFVKYQLMQIPSCSAHYNISSTGEKVVLTTRTGERKKYEKWQRVQPMGKETELREINKIEKNERLQSDPHVARTLAHSKINQLRTKLISSGFCRDVKPYNPPSDVDEKINKICKKIFNDSTENIILINPELKFKFLISCNQEFDYEIPNSELFRMKTVEDVRTFYQTPIKGLNNYDSMVHNPSNVPKNLHVIPEPIRFHPDSDTLFGGVSAFPGPRRELQGLRAKKKYPVYNDNFVWPDV